MNIQSSHGSATVCLLSLLILSATACGSDGGTEPAAPVATRLEILNAEPVVLVNSTLALQARVVDQNGSAMSDVPVSWSSDDVTTATVDPTTGVLSGVNGGEVRIVASAAALSASVMAVVSYPIGHGQTIVRLRASSDTVEYLEEVGLSHFGDRLGTDDGDYSLLLWSEDGALWGLSTVLTVYTPGRIAAGKLDFSPVDIQAIRSDRWGSTATPFVLFETDIGTDHQRAWLSTDGWIVSEIVELPVGPGTRMGQFRGRFFTNVSAYSVTWNAGEAYIRRLGVEGTLYADIATDLGHFPVPVVSLLLNGGPYPGVAGVDYADYHRSNTGSDGRLSFELDRDGEWVGDLAVIAANDPQVGIWSISPADPTNPDPPQVEYWAGASFRDNQMFWYSQSGELQVDRAIQPPAPDLTGELRGTLTIDLAEWTLFTPGGTGQFMQSSGTFHVPWLDSSAQAPLSQHASIANAISARWLNTTVRTAAAVGHTVAR